MTDQMNIQEYKASNRKKKVPQEIIQRWNERIIPRSLHTMGRSGALQYLADYGKSIAAPKCILLALQAEQNNAIAMADEFWSKAYQLQFGIRPVSMSEEGVPQAAVVERLAPVVASNLPIHLQPGKVVTMQPIDAPDTQDREYFITNPDYLGMPKRDGNRLVVIAEAGKIYYQSRSQKLRECPDIRMEETLLEIHRRRGDFVLDGELVFYDSNGGEHRTGAQAATINIKIGKPTDQPLACFEVFDCLYVNNCDLTSYTKSYRWLAAENLVGESDDDCIDIVPLSLSGHEKREMVKRQQDENREGEVWMMDGPYIGGKHETSSTIFRTKYRKAIDCLVTGLTPTTAQGRPFGAIQISWNGKPMGAVGTGYDVPTMCEIRKRFDTGAPLIIKVSTQGFTETGGIWHGVFVDFVDEA